MISTLLAQSFLEIYLVILQGQVGILTRMVALDVVRAVVLLHVVDVVRMVVMQLAVDVVALRRSVRLPDQQRMHPMQEL